ncbi:MAG TPA: zinc-binding dehydrogenase [Gaiellaceae bacterium]
MRAARLHELGGTPQVDEVDAPEGANLISVTAAGLNPVDISIGTGRFYGGSPDTPYVIGSEGVGKTADGRRIWFRGNAAVAEVAVAAPDNTYDIPDGVDDELALACGIAGVTGWLAVSWRTRVTPDDTVLVLGASGSVGAAALQGAKVLGAGRVIGAARNTERVSDVADEVVELSGSYSLPEATVIVDALWGEPAERALEAAAKEVRFVQLGQSAGPTASLASAWVRGKVANILGQSLFSTPHDVIATGYRELCEHARDGRVKLDVKPYSLEDVGEAWERQSSGAPGAKIVVSV